MARSLEILITGDESAIGTAFLKAMPEKAKRVGMDVSVTKTYEGKSHWLSMFGIGSPNRNGPRLEHIKKGGHVACWDLGYWHRGKDPARAHLRVSINHTHPTLAYMDASPVSNARWVSQGIRLREDYKEDGHIVVVGMGPKSRRFLNINNWEVETLKRVQSRFPGRKIVYRPKPQGLRDPHIPWKHVDGTSPIDALLNGAALAICRHSNVAVDACIQGIPVECEDGAALWLYKNNPKPNIMQRIDFLSRVSWWQWGIPELDQAWEFLDSVATN